LPGHLQLVRNNVSILFHGIQEETVFIFMSVSRVDRTLVVIIAIDIVTTMWSVDSIIFVQ
jgi:hypothetical protein